MAAPPELQHWPLDRLIPYARNPRRNDDAVDKIAAAIKEFGFRVPVLAKSDGLVIDGHLRLKAAQRLGLASVPVLLADDLTDTQIKAFRISVNRMAELAEWDTELLALEIEDLRLDDFDIDLTGFDDDDLDRLIGQEEMLSEKQEELQPIKWTRILISVRSDQAFHAEFDSVLDAARKLGAEIDFSGN